ncbi:MAG: (d)CMP kinase [Flavobacteriales bacterium]|nr:(d)CMP kinase [Flavobacteriales bacterium]MCZ2444094.1 (d)CMP kinase [Flavobacteriales bacterium]
MINIAIDGYSSCGKSTLAKQLAKSLHYIYIDTGAMYRAVALYALQNGFIDNGEPNMQRIELALPELMVEFKINPESGNTEVHLNGQPVEALIRYTHIASLASRISQNRMVRDKLQYWQKQMAQRKGVIMDGRDIATVIMPDAELKIFMTANPQIRAKRRYEELKAQGKQVSIEEVEAEQKLRDFQDTNRKEDPLRQHPEAQVLDNSNLTPEQQLALVLQWIQALTKFQ